ncbi:MAG: hypothetical protein MZV64_12475, partial [Ignavibacteriales bacterium]|nr:hypothetical protein [Ignavibacteriales bacterium]
MDPLHGLGPRPVDDLIKGGHDARFPFFRPLLVHARPHLVISVLSFRPRPCPGSREIGERVSC